MSTTSDNARHRFILGTAGHIDHGKTALVRALTGIDTDRLQEEQDRGISIDLGFAHLDAGDVRIGIVDVPGHERFIRNMLAGAAGVDVGLLVIAADDSVMPQTREHLAILELLDIPTGLITITKIDLVDPDWIAMVEEDVRTLVSGTFLEDAPIIPTSANTGEGIDALRDAVLAMAGQVSPRRRDGCFRLPIDRVFPMTGLGTVVTGSVAAGQISVGDDVELQPSGQRGRVRSIQSHGAAVDRVESGQRAAINVTGVHHGDVMRGDVLSLPDHLAPGHRVTVSLNVLSESPWPLKHRSHVRLHVGTMEVPAELRLLSGTALEPGDSAVAQLICREPVATTARQPFVLRLESPRRTVGGGHVIEPMAPGRSRRSTEPLPFDRLLHREPIARAEAALHLAALDPLDELALARNADLTPTEVREAIESLEADGTLTMLRLSAQRTVRVHTEALEQTVSNILAAVDEMHAAAPLSARIPRARLMARLDYLDATLLMAIFAHLRQTGRLDGDDESYNRPGFEPALSKAQRSLLGTVVESYRAAGFKPDDIDAMATRTGAPPDQVRTIVELCVQQGDLVHIAGDVLLHTEWADEMRRRIGEHLQDGRGATLSEIKDLLGTTRKFAVPICEHLDRTGITVRRGDVRVLAPGASA